MQFPASPAGRGVVGEPRTLSSSAIATAVRLAERSAADAVAPEREVASGGYGSAWHVPGTGASAGPARGRPADRGEESQREAAEGEEHAKRGGAAPSFAALGFPEQHLRGRAGRLGHRPVRGARPGAGAPEMDDRH